MNLTNNELKLAIFIGIFGLIMYSTTVIKWLDSVSLLTGYIFYQVIYFVSLYILSKHGLVLFGIRITSLKQTIGLFLITTAFLMTISWCSGYVQLITRSNQDISGVYLQTDDGLSWSYVTQYITKGVGDCATNPNCSARIISFSIIPFFLALLGGYMVTGRAKL